MTSYVPAKKNAALVFGVCLFDATTGLIKSNPTIASGDFKISKDGGAFANLTNLPAANPASGKRVEISLTSTEMNADNVTVICSDQTSPAEWGDVAIHIQTAARQIDDLAYPSISGRSTVVDAAGLVDANMVKAGPTGAGTAITARDIGASVLLSTGTGTGQLDFTAGVVKANLAQILGTVLTETAGLLAGGFKKFFNVASPAHTVASIDQTGDSYARLGAPAGASHAADVAAVKTDTAAIKAKTDNLPASPAATSDIPTANITAIKAKTDSLTFTKPGEIDANIQSVNDTTVTGSGTSGSPWGP